MNNRVILENNDPFGYSFKVKYRELTGFLHQIPLKSISFVIASAIMLSGCGGGSSKTTVSTFLSSIIEQSSSAAAQEKIAAAAIAQPNAGSVTQSSNTTQSGITTDSVSTSVEYDDNGQIIYTVENGDEWDVDSAASDTDTLYEGRYTDSVWNFAELYKKLPDGRLWVDVYSNIGRPTGAMPDTDFLAGGIWVYVPDNATNVDDFTFGAFVHGEDPYTQDNLIGLTDVYTYTGDATGVYSVLADERNYFFDADVTLRADFDDGANLGTIGGRIHDISVDDELVEGDPILNLGTAEIGDTYSGFFNGVTDMDYEGENYTGKWGGQFFGNDGSDPPGSVAGTFGAATSDGENSVLGVYGAGSPTP